MVSFGDRLRAARERKGITQLQVMKLTGINNKTLSGYEKNVSEPDYASLSTLAELYEISIDYLINGKNPIDRAAEHRADLADVIKQMGPEFERLNINENTKERIQEMIKLMMWDDIQKAKKPD